MIGKEATEEERWRHKRNNKEQRQRLLVGLIDLCKGQRETIQYLVKENKMAVEALKGSVATLASNVQQLINKVGSGSTPTGATQEEVDQVQQTVDSLNQQVESVLSSGSTVATPATLNQ